LEDGGGDKATSSRAEPLVQVGGEWFCNALGYWRSFENLMFWDEGSPNPRIGFARKVLIGVLLCAIFVLCTSVVKELFDKTTTETAQRNQTFRAKLLESSNRGLMKEATEFAEASPPRALPRTLRYVLKIRSWPWVREPQSTREQRTTGCPRYSALYEILLRSSGINPRKVEAPSLVRGTRSSTSRAIRVAAQNVNANGSAGEELRRITWIL